jgi:metal-sulfur cluster biosynthetic enzyme
MIDTITLHKRVVNALEQVIDPETGADVIRMRLVLNLKIHDDGTAEYVFRPSSPLCPIALTLIMQIIEVIKSVEGIIDQKVTVVDYTGADELNAILETLPPTKSP